MRLSISYAEAGLTVYGFVQRIADGLYYTLGPPASFGAWVAEANHRILMAEDGTFLGMYAATVATTSAIWTNGTYRAVYYVDAIAGLNMIGDITFFIRGLNVIDDSGVYDFMQRTAGLSKENMYWDQMVYSGGNLTGGRMRLFATYPFDVTTDTPLATYALIATYTGTNLSTWKLERQ